MLHLYQLSSMKTDLFFIMKSTSFVSFWIKTVIRLVFLVMIPQNMPSIFLLRCVKGSPVLSLFSRQNSVQESQLKLKRSFGIMWDLFSCLKHPHTVNGFWTMGISTTIFLNFNWEWKSLAKYRVFSRNWYKKNLYSSENPSLSLNWDWYSFVVLFDILFSTMDDLLTMIFLLIVPIFLKVRQQNTSKLALSWK